MSLTGAKGPLSNNRAGRFSPEVPDGVVYIEPHHRRIEARVGGRTVLDTERALMVHRPGQPLAYAFPVDELGDLPHELEVDAAGYARVPWDAVDVWFEEGRKLVAYPPNPYHRVDCRRTTRRLRAELGGVTLVDSGDTIIVFETALAPKLYVDPVHVRTDLLRRSETVTYCNYKGYTTYYSALIDGVVYDDVVWSYDEPLPESTPIKGMLSFESAKVDLKAHLPG